MRKISVFASLFVLASLVLAACGGTPTPQVIVVTATPESTSNPDGDQMMETVVALFEGTMTAQAQGQAEEPAPATSTPAPSATPTQGFANSLVNPVLFDADSQPAGDGEGYFDIGVNPGQLGIVFGWDLSWGANSFPGEGCEMVVLGPGWYENFQITDGRYEIYTLPYSDPAGWRTVLVEQRVAEQAAHYGCPAEKTPPTWGE